jgi:flavin-dependent thymidylate synthase
MVGAGLVVAGVLLLLARLRAGALARLPPRFYCTDTALSTVRTMETRRPTNPAAEEILGQYFPVLDHGFVALVDYMGGDDSIERAARVSYGYGTRKSSQTRGLIRYLRRHRHTTPSEMVELKFHCAMPMFVARQWIRHRTANVNEYSGRYSLMPLLFYTPRRGDFALQSAQNNQGRSDQAAAEHLYAERARWERMRTEAADTYGWLVGEDVARETRAHRAAAVHLHAVVLEDRPAQPAALPDAARRSARAVRDPRLRRGHGRHGEARGAALVRGVDRLRRRRRHLSRGELAALRDCSTPTTTACRTRGVRVWTARHSPRTTCRPARRAS